MIKNLKFKIENCSGQSLFEVVVALAISAVIVVALVSLASSSIRNATFAKNKTLASRYAEEAIEWLRGQRDSDIDTFKSNSLSPVWCLENPSWSSPGSCSSGDEISGTIFLRELSFPDDGATEIIEANVRVYWTDAQGEHEVRSATNFADWRER